MRRYAFNFRLREWPLRHVAAMQRSFPQFRHTRAGAGAVRWAGTLQPTEESPVYTIEILHEIWRGPRVWVVNPALAVNPPHVYRFDDNALCLYFPPEWSWRPAESLASTIVPWTALWLYYYEAWLVTGDWLGPSSHHEPSNKETVP